MNLPAGEIVSAFTQWQGVAVIIVTLAVNHIVRSVRRKHQNW
jgi:hypothetical protein